MKSKTGGRCKAAGSSEETRVIMIASRDMLVKAGGVVVAPASTGGGSNQKKTSRGRAPPAPKNGVRCSRESWERRKGCFYSRNEKPLSDIKSRAHKADALQLARRASKISTERSPSSTLSLGMLELGKRLCILIDIKVLIVSTERGRSASRVDIECQP